MSHAEVKAGALPGSQNEISDPTRLARLFLALWPTEDVVKAVSEHRRTWPWPPPTKMVGPQRLHLTLHFLGNVARERLPELHEGLQVGFDPFVLELGRGELWRGGLAVLRPVSTPAGLGGLRSRLADALRRLDLEPTTEPYRPHVTLARQAQGVEPPALQARIRWAVGSYALVESEPGPPSRYTVLKSWMAPN